MRDRHESNAVRGESVVLTVSEKSSKNQATTPTSTRTVTTQKCTGSPTRLKPRKPAKSRGHETTRTDLEAKRSTGEPYDYFFLKSARRDESNGTLFVEFRAGHFLKSVILTIGPLNRINQSIAQCAGRPAYCLIHCAGRPACHSLYLRYDTKLPTSLTCWKRLPVAP